MCLICLFVLNYGDSLSRAAVLDEQILHVPIAYCPTHEDESYVCLGDFKAFPEVNSYSLGPQADVGD
jgi:hypothetical protein